MSYATAFITCHIEVMDWRPLDLWSNRMAMKEVSVVLAHGAWADGSSWARVITALKAEAVNVLAAPLPGLLPTTRPPLTAASTGLKGRSYWWDTPTPAQSSLSHVPNE
jgi:hypothetical protein